MNRPVGVTILAILEFIGAGALVIFAILAFVGGGMLATIMSQQGQQGAGAFGAIAGAGAAVVGIVFLVFAAICALIGWGLWGLKNWARIVCIVLAALFAVGNLLGVISHFNIASLIGLAIDGLIIWYLLRPDVAGAFKGAQGSSASA